MLSERNEKPEFMGEVTANYTIAKCSILSFNIKASDSIGKFTNRKLITEIRMKS